MECHGERVSGAAKRRRERRLRQWHRHERLTVQMALCEALHHAAPQVERGENSAPRGQKTHKAGGRPSVLKERAVSPRIAVPSLATPLLAGQAAEAIDPSSLRFLAASALAARRKEEEEEKKKKVEAKRKETQRQAADAMERARLLLEQAGKRRKRKKRRKKRLPRASSPRSSRLARQRVRVHASVFEAALLRSAWFNSGYMFWLRFWKLFGRIPLYFHVMDPVFSVPPWYPAVTCSVSASPEEYQRTGISGRRLHIFLQPLVLLAVTCSASASTAVHENWFLWETTSSATLCT